MISRCKRRQEERKYLQYQLRYCSHTINKLKPSLEALKDLIQGIYVNNTSIFGIKRIFAVNLDIEFTKSYLLDCIAQLKIRAIESLPWLDRLNDGFRSISLLLLACLMNRDIIVYSLVRAGANPSSIDLSCYINKSEDCRHEDRDILNMSRYLYDYKPSQSIWLVKYYYGMLIDSLNSFHESLMMESYPSSSNDIYCMKCMSKYDLYLKFYPCHDICCQTCFWDNIISKNSQFNDLKCPICSNIALYNPNWWPIKLINPISLHDDITRLSSSQRKKLSRHKYLSLPNSYNAMNDDDISPMKRPKLQALPYSVVATLFTGSNRNQRDNEVFLAVQQHNVVRLQALEEAGIHIDVINEYGQTPLFIACWKGYASIVDYLLSCLHADTSICDNAGCSPRSVAELNDHMHVCRVLDEFILASSRDDSNHSDLSDKTSSSLELSENDRLIDGLDSNSLDLQSSSDGIVTTMLTAVMKTLPSTIKSLTDLMNSYKSLDNVDNDQYSVSRVTAEHESVSESSDKTEVFKTIESDTVKQTHLIITTPSPSITYIDLPDSICLRGAPRDAFYIDHFFTDSFLLRLLNLSCRLPVTPNHKLCSSERCYYCDIDDSICSQLENAVLFALNSSNRRKSSQFNGNAINYVRSSVATSNQELKSSSDSSSSSKTEHVHISSSECDNYLVEAFPHMRFLIYVKPHGSLAAHIDLTRTSDDILESTSIKSTHTFILYLTDCAHGGSTILLTSVNFDVEKYACDDITLSNDIHEEGYERNNMNTSVMNSHGIDLVVKEVQPRYGRLLVFPHLCPHAGNVIKSLPKILLRGEIYIATK